MNILASTKATQKVRWLAAALAVATFILFSPAIRYEYLVYDDGVYVYANQAVLKGLTLEGVRYAFTSIAGGSWMPLTWLSHMADVSLFGPAAAGPHGMNILLHSVSAAILFLALQRMTGRVWPSLFVAATFAFHPLRNESVAWVAERKDVLSTLFWMLGLLAYARYVETPGAKPYALVGACLALGLMAKPMLVTFPFALLLLDFWPLNRLGHNWSALRRNLWPRVREKIPLFCLVAMIAAATFISQSHSGAVDQTESPLLLRFGLVIDNYGFYLAKIFAPIGLSIIHPEPTASVARTILPALILVGVTGVCLGQLFRRPWLATGWFWFVGTLVPVVGIVRIGHVLVSERYTYIPSVGLGLAIAWTLVALAQARPRLQSAAVGLGATVVVACALVLRHDLPRWEDSTALFETAIRVAPHPVTYNNLAAHLLDRGEYERAIEPLNQAIAIDPNYVKALLNRITAYAKTGRREEAKADYEQLVKIEPRNAEGYTSRAEVFLNLSRLDEAIHDFTSAINLETNSASAYNNRATAQLLKGELPAAVDDCTRAINLNPGYANAYSTRGNVYSRMGDRSRALLDYTKAIELSPADPLAYNNRAAAYYGLKQYDEAWADLRRCEALGGTPHDGLVRALMQATKQLKHDE
jgi:tetratricopeptide (TPR) repeat protein